MAEFGEALRDCNLEDIGYSGYPFTWSNRRFGSPNLIEERLDMFLCYSSWGDLNIFSFVSHMTL